MIPWIIYGQLGLDKQLSNLRTQLFSSQILIVRPFWKKLLKNISACVKSDLRFRMAEVRVFHNTKSSWINYPSVQPITLTTNISLSVKKLVMGWVGEPMHHKTFDNMTHPRQKPTLCHERDVTVEIILQKNLSIAPLKSQRVAHCALGCVMLPNGAQKSKSSTKVGVIQYT